MTESMAYIWARRIHDGIRFLEEVESKYGRSDVNLVSMALYKLYGDYHEPLEVFNN